AGTGPEVAQQECFQVSRGHLARTLRRSSGRPRMSARVCSAEGCGRPHLARGWCSNHYERWRLYGDALAVQRFRTPAEAFAARTERQGDCLIWTGAKTGGYGSIRVDGRAMGAHRYAWERENGPVPDGLVVDHYLFCDTACCEV